MTPSARATPDVVELRPSAPIRTLLVDLDGTLLANRDWPLRIEFIYRSLTLLKRYGGRLQIIKAMRAVSTALRLPASERTAELTNDRRAIVAFAGAMGIATHDAERVLYEIVGSLFPQLERHFYPVKGAKEFLLWARERFPLILATTPVWALQFVELRLKWAGVDPAMFRSITHAGRMHAVKPTREYYEQVLEQEGLKAENCLLVGDDVTKDLPATKAGIRVWILESGPAAPYPIRKDRAQSWHGSYADLRRFLEGHSGK